jgi:hypothetical protein
MADLERTMRVTTVLAVFILLMLYPGRARAQAVEVGAGVALSCKSLEQSPCAYKWGRVDAVHVAWWSSPSLVVEARAARLEGPTTRIVAVTERVSPTRYFSRSYTLRDERRTVLQASMLYHFRPGRPIRPFVGGGAGSLWWRGEAFCDRHQIDCQRVLPENAPGVLRAREWVASFAGGVAVDAWRGAIFRGGVRDTVIPSTLWHRSDESARRRAVRGELPEFFFNIGYRW